jgi:hypothetical protein
LFASVSVAAGLFGCDAGPLSSETEVDDPVEQAASAIVAGAEAVKTVGDSIGDGQAETASLIMSDGAGNTFNIVTYNDQDFPPFLEQTATSRTVRRQASLLGWSVKVNSDPWFHQNLFPGFSDTFPIFWGDPALGQIPGTGTVFLANLAALDSRIPASGAIVNNADGSGDPCRVVGAQGMRCGMTAALGGACIARSTDFGQSFGLFQCVSNNQRFYDGGSLAGASGDRMYASFQDAETRVFDVWLSTGGSSFSMLPNPFPGKTMDLHPRLRSWGSGVFIAGLDAFGALWVNFFDPGTGAWGTPRMVASSTTDTRVTLRNGKRLRQNGAFDFRVGAVSQFVTQLAFWFTIRDGNGATRLRGATCPLGSGACTLPSSWITPAGVNAFMPAVANATRRPKLDPNNPVFLWKVSYQTENQAPDGQVRLAHGNFGSGVTFTEFIATPAQTPCITGHEYWGDYDDMQVISNNTSNPRFVRPFTDSTDGTCMPTHFAAKPQHVSRFTF